jgi:hypothetical protein
MHSTIYIQGSSGNGCLQWAGKKDNCGCDFIGSNESTHWLPGCEGVAGGSSIIGLV